MFISALFLVKCIEKDNKNIDSGDTPMPVKDLKGENFAGSVICGECHKDTYEKHLETAHYLTSQVASGSSIKGHFDSGKNFFPYSDSVKVVMQREGNDYYQIEYINGLIKRKERFDITVGSGKKGQTFLYWNAAKILQLPVFYYSDYDEWANSPGYPGRVIYNRPITSRCLECHTTFVKKLSDEQTEPEDFDKNKIIFGVDCEKCHGPASRHVAFQKANPKVKEAEYIVNPAKLSRLQQLDLCALCHGGRMNKIRPSFSFKAGDSLENFFSKDTSVIDVADIDVHGNQLGLLSASKCFRMSEMTCSSCHNTHENESGNIAMFSGKCLNCHNSKHNNLCALSKSFGTIINSHCVDCHMPVQASKAITFLRAGSVKPSTASMRSHYIKVYPHETQKILRFINRNANNKK